MSAPPPLHRIVHELIPDAGVVLRRLFDGAVENSGLLASDYMTLRDLLELSGYAADEPLHALLLVLLAALDEGSLCVEITPERLQRRLTELAGAEAVGAWPHRIVQGLRNGGYPELIAADNQPDRPIVRRQIGDRTFLYFQKQHGHERDLARLLQQRLADTTLLVGSAVRTSAAGPHSGPYPLASTLDDLRAILREVLEERPLRAGDATLQLDAQQQLALALALLRRFVLVSGGPGTGKTSLVLTLLRCLARLPDFDVERIALAAPTGRAAQRLNDALQQGLATLPAPLAEADARLLEITGQTVHRLLGYNPDRGTFRHHDENLLATDLVIVDEVSMVGLELMSRFFHALAPTARVVLLGDRDQLPSVDAGAVLAHLTRDEAPGYGPAVRRAVAALFPDLKLPGTDRQRLQDVLVVLEQNHRSQAHIQAVARAVNAQDDMALLDVPAVAAADVSIADLEKQGGCCRLQGTEDLDRWRGVLLHWAEHHYRTGRDGGASFLQRVGEVRLAAASEPDAAARVMLDELFITLNRARILTLVRDGAWGCEGINQFLAHEFRRRVDPASRGPLFVGAAVLVTRNDYHLQLFNGDVGLSLRSTSGGYRVVFPRGGSYLSLPAEAVPAHELAFALTVHKAQGSEYGQVLLVLPPQGARRLLTKEMVYTGITRARHLAVLCGSAEILQTAIRRRVEREANLLEPGEVGTLKASADAGRIP